MSEAFEIPATWYDGHSALRHEGMVRWGGQDQLELVSGMAGTHLGAAPIHIAYDDLDFAEKLPGARIYRLISQPDFRLSLPEKLPAGLERHLPASSEYGAWIDRFGLGKAAIAFGIASIAAVALFMTAPQWLGPMVPESWERQIGSAMIGDFGNRICSTPEGDAALGKLLDAVDPAETQVRAGIANIDMVNAVALPGGQVLLFDGLIQQAETPAELAGVLGHEVGHVRERHVMTALLRQFGLSVLLAGANSGIGDTAFGLASMGYSRDAEREADAFARRQMARSDVSPIGAADFFDRMAEKHGDTEGENSLLGWIASHPSAGERARAYRSSAKEGADYPPVLSQSEFEALKSACADDPDVEAFDFF